MINLSQLNNLILTTFFFSILIFNVGFSDTAVDIWKKQENKKSPDEKINTEEIIIIVKKNGSFNKNSKWIY